MDKTTSTSPHLALDYQPSQPHGWPSRPGQQVGSTVGGHTTTKDFTAGDRNYRISLVLTDPVYESRPADPDVNFRKTLRDAFGKWYTFHYTGGLTGRNVFSVQSYNVYVDQPDPRFSPVYGADLFVVHNPGRRPDTSMHVLRWIQVVKWTGTSIGSSPTPYVDNLGCAHPFAHSGGLTSVGGTQVVNFDEGAVVPSGATSGGDDTALSDHFLAEVFLTRNTRTKDAAGKQVIEILGGLKYGWQVEQV